jgi:hypothetical protein
MLMVGSLILLLSARTLLKMAGLVRPIGALDSPLIIRLDCRHGCRERRRVEGL